MNFKSGFNFFKHAKSFFSVPKPKNVGAANWFPTVKSMKTNMYLSLTQCPALHSVQFASVEQRAGRAEHGEAAREGQAVEHGRRAGAGDM